MSIMIKELVSIVCAAAVRGPSWVGLHVLCYSDNMSVARALNKGSSREPSDVAMHLLRTLILFQPFLGLSYELNMWLALTMAPTIQFQRLTCPYFLHRSPTLPGTNSHSRGALDSIGEGATRLALRKVEESFYFFLQKGLVISTRKCYEAGQRRFLFFCDSVNLLIYLLLRNLFLYLFCILVMTRDLARL